MGRLAVTRQTWTAFVAALAFVLAAVLLVVLPVPFVTWSPGAVVNTLGKTRSKPVIGVAGAKTHPTSGRLDLTTVSVTRADARLSLPEALLSYGTSGRDTLPRDAVYPPGKSAAQVEKHDRVQMETSQDEAKVAGLRAAGHRVRKRPAVSSVRVGSAAYDHLKPADLILAINDHPVKSKHQARKRIRAVRPGSPVVFSISRDRQHRRVTIIRGRHSSTKDLDGLTVGTGYQFRPRIRFGLGRDIGGPSAGLVFSLAIYDKLTPGDLLHGRRVAGSGTIDANGKVGSIGGIHQKVAAAADNKARYFLVPAANCDDLEDLHTSIRLIKVDTLKSAITALGKLNQHKTADLPRCD